MSEPPSASPPTPAPAPAADVAPAPAPAPAEAVAPAPAPAPATPAGPLSGGGLASPETLAALDRLRRRRLIDQIVGLAIVALTFGGSLGLSTWAHREATPPVAKAPAPPTSAGIDGFPRAVEAFSLISRARSLSEREHLRGIVAEEVKLDGKVDLTQRNARVRFVFQSHKGQGPQPPRIPGVLPHRHYCGLQRVVVAKKGLYAERDRSAYPCKPEEVPGLPDPTCNAEELFRLAVASGAPKGRRARIEYYRSRKGPAYRVSIRGTKHRLEFAEDCKTKLTAKEGLGIVP